MLIARSSGARWLVVAIALALLATACQQASPEVATASRAGVDSPDPITTEPVDTPTATSVPTPAPTATPVPTATPAPTATPEPTPTSVPTPTPTPEPTPEPGPLDEAFEMSSLESVVCPVGAVAAGVTCSVASLPLDPFDPVPDETVQIMIALVDNGDPQGAGPVVFLQGGPGVGAVTGAPRFVGADHDLLLFDQRGTGFSTPYLGCGEVDRLWEAQYTNDPAVRLGSDADILDGYQACGERLVAEGHNLDHFNTGTTAADVELIRRLFEYEQWSLWGISYGTRLGLTIMREYPQGVRSAVLDSIVPFEIDFFATIPEHGLRSITALDQACDIDDCNDDYGDFFENLSALTLRLNDNPAVVTATRASGATFPMRIDGKQLITMVFIQLYSTRSLRALPRQIAGADFGGLEELVSTFVSRRDPLQLDLSAGLYYSTWCREEFPFHDTATDDAVLNDSRAQFGRAIEEALGSQGLDRLCAFFQVAPSPPVDDAPLTSDIPTLVFAGAFDPITPPEWSRQVAASLTNSTYVEMRDHGHGMATDCPRMLRAAFLSAPQQALDASCADQALTVQFE